jgi:hypothetical protein
MIDGILFDKIEQIARRVKRNQQPFGGIQVNMLCGVSKHSVQKHK